MISVELCFVAATEEQSLIIISFSYTRKNYTRAFVLLFIREPDVIFLHYLDVFWLQIIRISFSRHSTFLLVINVMFYVSVTIVSLLKHAEVTPFRNNIR